MRPVQADEAGSRLLVQVDAIQHDECPLPSGFVQSAARLDIEIDEAILASRELVWSSASDVEGTKAVSMTFLSEPLDAGSHEVRLLLDGTNPFVTCTKQTLCIGSADDDGHQARMLLLELVPD